MSEAHATEGGGQSSSVLVGWEELLDRFEMGWKGTVVGLTPHGLTPRIEEYLPAAPRMVPAAVLYELIIIEVAYRRRHGDRPGLREYRKRFPTLDPERLAAAVAALPEPVLLQARSEVSTGPYVPELTGPYVPQSMDPGPGRDHTGRRPMPGELPRLGDYDLLSELGKGGMGVVFRARQRSANRIVALKVIRPDRLEDIPPAERQIWLERFHTEAQATARIEHPNVVAVYDVGTFGGCPYYSMRYIEGQSLAAILRDGPVSNVQAAGYLEPAARAVHSAHLHGIIHRDLKPRNLLIDQGGQPFVADFGLAKWMEAAPEMTQTGDRLGTPPYMSPEQVRDSAHVTPASDVYSLGATLYALLTGRPPFQAASVAEILHQIITCDPVPPRRLNPAIHPDLETVCLKCLEKEPTHRYASAAALADDLHRFSHGEPIQARPAGMGERALKWARRRPAVAAAVAIACVAVLSVSLLGYYLAHIAAQKFQAESDKLRAEADKSTAEELKRKVEIERDRLEAQQDQDLERAYYQLQFGLGATAQRYTVVVVSRPPEPEGTIVPAPGVQGSHRDPFQRNPDPLARGLDAFGRSSGPLGSTVDPLGRSRLPSQGMLGPGAPSLSQYDPLTGRRHPFDPLDPTGALRRQGINTANLHPGAKSEVVATTKLTKTSAYYEEVVALLAGVLESLPSDNRRKAFWKKYVNPNDSVLNEVREFSAFKKLASQFAP